MRNTGADQKLVRVSSNTSRYSTIVSGDIRIWDMFLRLTLASCLWPLNWVSVISGEDQRSAKNKLDINACTVYLLHKADTNNTARVVKRFMVKVRAGIQERRQREREQRNQSILEAAKKVFIQKGYLRATIDDIALEAQVCKRTVYQYFKTKDELYFSLLVLATEATSMELVKVEKKLRAGKCTSGAQLIHDVFEAFFLGYQLDPESFLVLQLFQQTGMVWEIEKEIRLKIIAKGRFNYEIGRAIFELGMEKGLIKQSNAYPLVDVIWGQFVGIVLLEGIKSQAKEDNKYLRETLKIGEQFIIDAVAIS